MDLVNQLDFIQQKIKHYKVQENFVFVNKLDSKLNQYNVKIMNSILMILELVKKLEVVLMEMFTLVLLKENLLQ